jgi:hypothetical protein
VTPIFIGGIEMKYFASALVAICAIVMLSPSASIATPCSRCAESEPGANVGTLSIASLAGLPGAQSSGSQTGAVAQSAASQATGFNPCCPPWNADQLRQHLFYTSQHPITGAYTVKFVPSTLLNTQIRNYLLYVGALGSTNPSLRIIFKLYKETSPGSGAFGPPSALSSVQVDWTTAGLSPGMSNFFFNDLMDANVLYRVETTVELYNGPPGFLQPSCVTTHVDILVQS